MFFFATFRGRGGFAEGLGGVRGIAGQGASPDLELCRAAQAAQDAQDAQAAVKVRHGMAGMIIFGEKLRNKIFAPDFWSFFAMICLE